MSEIGSGASPSDVEAACARLLDGQATGAPGQTRADIELLTKVLPVQIRALQTAIRAAQTTVGEAQRRVDEGRGAGTRRTEFAHAQRLARMSRALTGSRAELRPRADLTPPHETRK